MKLTTKHKLPRFYKWVVFNKETKEIAATTMSRTMAFEKAKKLNNKAMLGGHEPVYQVVIASNVEVV